MCKIRSWHSYTTIPSPVRTIFVTGVININIIISKWRKKGRKRCSLFSQFQLKNSLVFIVTDTRGIHLNDILYCGVYSGGDGWWGAWGTELLANVKAKVGYRIGLVSCTEFHALNFMQLRKLSSIIFFSIKKILLLRHFKVLELKTK